MHPHINITAENECSKINLHQISLSISLKKGKELMTIKLITVPYGMISTNMSEISFTERDITPKAGPEAIDRFDRAIISWQVLQHLHLS